MKADSKARVETSDERLDTWSERCLSLFLGANNRHGEYDNRRVRPVGPGEKVNIKDAGAVTVDGPATVTLWRGHLSGDGMSLGVAPLRSDDTASWGAIDYDIRPADLADLRERVDRHGLPLAVVRSKSGAAHLYLFLTAPAPHAAVSAALDAMARVLGFGPEIETEKVEFFPKASMRADSSGGWLNMPYRGGDQSDRYAVKRGGLEMTVAEFLAYAEGLRQPPEALTRLTALAPPAASKAAARARRPQAAVQGDGAGHAARELVRLSAELAAKTCPGRKNLLYASARRVGAMIAAGWIEKSVAEPELVGAARRCGLEWVDVGRTIDSGFEHGMDDAPPMIGGARPVVERIVLVRGGDETMLTLVLSGIGELTMPARELCDFKKFRTRCAVDLKVAFHLMKDADWMDAIREPLAAADEVELPKDETVAFQFANHLLEFLTNRYRGEQIDDLLCGKPFEDEEAARHYFRLRDLVQFLRRSDVFSNITATQTGKLLREFADEGRGGITTKKLMDKASQVRWVASAAVRGVDYSGPLLLPADPASPV